MSLVLFAYDKLDCAWICLVPGPPSNVRVSATNHTTILVLWEPPTQPNGELKDYEITRSRITENTNDQTSIIYYRVGATARLYEIINVGIGTAYEVTVRAVNRKGQSGERSDPKIVVGKFRSKPSLLTIALQCLNLITNYSHTTVSSLQYCLPMCMTF